MWRDPGRLESGALGARRRQLIGAGVFATSGHALADLGSSARVLWVRAVAGGIAVCGAIAFAALIFSAYVLRGTPRPAPAKTRSLGVYAYMRNPGAPPCPPHLRTATMVERAAGSQRLSIRRRGLNDQSNRRTGRGFAAAGFAAGGSSGGCRGRRRRHALQQALRRGVAVPGDAA